MDHTALPGSPAPLKDAILIAGPTASGKSRLALATARAVGGAIVNADSMQIYAQLSIITARPTNEDMRLAPHHLYGHVDARSPYSTGAWLADVAKLAASDLLAGKRPVFVGGTGLYFKALTEGLSRMPSIPEDIRDHWRRRLGEEGSEPLHRLLSQRDAAAAEAIRATDGQRIVRALEVLEASGRSIISWQSEREPALVDAATARKVVIEADRALLARNISRRFDEMVRQRALEEVRAFLDLGISPDMPAMKAIGVPELGACLGGRCSLEEAIERAKATSRQYAKRQDTWFRNQMGADWRRIGMDAAGTGSLPCL